MTAAQLFAEGINLMFFGMGFVLIFLLLLIWAIGLMSKLINRYFPDPLPAEKVPAKNTAVGVQQEEIEALRPVIVAAIAHHRRRQGLN